MKLAPDSMIRDYKLSFEMFPNFPASKLIEKNKFEYWSCKHYFWKN